MVERLADVGDAMEVGRSADLHDRLHAFSFGFAQLRSLDPASLAMLLSQWVEAVDHLPLEAVSRACRAWNKRQFPWAKSGLAPNADEIARAATEMMVGLRLEERDLRLITEAKVVALPPPMSDGQREANLRRFAGILTSATAGIVTGERTGADDRAAELRRRREAIEADTAERAARRATQGEPA